MAFFLRWWVMQNKKPTVIRAAESNIVRRLFAFVFQIFNLR